MYAGSMSSKHWYRHPSTGMPVAADAIVALISRIHSTAATQLGSPECLMRSEDIEDAEDIEDTEGAR